jgi:2',3'-cyclic-nucleotide 2'-phosphodiesterase (5'-nucleotidase family)
VRVTILHTNDIHGRDGRMAQIATLVRREKQEAQHAVLYLDAGDIEETTNRLSNLTKGTAMHRLFAHTTCDAATVGNACWLRYGPGVLAEHARVASYPLLLANFEPVEGPVSSVLLGEVGVFGLTAPFTDLFADTNWGFAKLNELAVARACARDLRRRGAKLVVFLSHLGLDVPPERWDDRRIAVELQGDVDLIIGAHTHDLLPDGEWIGSVLVAQAGEYGDHIGRVEVDGDSLIASVEPVPDDTEPLPAVAEEAARIEAEVQAMLGDVLGRVDEPLDAAWIAEMLRRRFDADVGIFAEGLAIAALPPGIVTRGALWEASETPANPGAATFTGVQLADLVARGNDPAFVAETPRPLRGRARGRLRVAGVEPAEIEPGRSYVVAATDWELDSLGGYTLAEWGVQPRYDFPTIVREAIEEDLRGSA